MPLPDSRDNSYFNSITKKGWRIRHGSIIEGVRCDYYIPLLPTISTNLLSGPKIIVRTLSVFVFPVSLKLLKILGHEPIHMPVCSPLIRAPSILTRNGISFPLPSLESTTCLGNWISTAPPSELGLTARSKLCLEGSANIPTNEPPNIL